VLGLLHTCSLAARENPGDPRRASAGTGLWAASLSACQGIVRQAGGSPVPLSEILNGKSCGQPIDDDLIGFAPCEAWLAPCAQYAAETRWPRFYPLRHLRARVWHSDF
jgi:hypothetical protein